MLNKIIFVPGLFLLLNMICITGSIAQLDSTDNNGTNYNKDRKVFWFYINLIKGIDKETKQDIVFIKRTGTVIESGLREKYDKSLWSSLGSGSRFLIGPYTNFKEAKEALAFYNGNTKKGTLPDSIYGSDNTTVYWFFLNVDYQKRLKAYKLKTSAQRVADGSRRKFDDALREGCTFQSVAIGPFWNYADAEEAKRLYRLSVKN
jgi:hypothetical protein